MTESPTVSDVEAEEREAAWQALLAHQLATLDRDRPSAD